MFDEVHWRDRKNDSDDMKEWKRKDRCDDEDGLRGEKFAVPGIFPEATPAAFRLQQEDECKERTCEFTSN